MYLHDIISVNRVDAKLYCLFIETKSQRKLFIAFKSDEELYTWQDAIYSHSLLSGISSPRNFVHRVHVGYDPVTGNFTVRFVLFFLAFLFRFGLTAVGV